MTTVNPISGDPFKPDEKLRPKPEQLKSFLESASREGGKELYGDDLVPYRLLLENADAFEQASSGKEKQEDLHKQMVHAVLRYSLFADHAILSAVELFKYHLHTLKLKLLDITTLASFIQGAENTIRRLNRDKLGDVIRMVRLQEMINERKKIIETLRQSPVDLTSELFRIAQYVQVNLVKIENRCEASIAKLSDPVVTGRKENQMIEDIKERPQKALHAGRITTQDLERTMQEVNQIAKMVSSIVGEDINTLRGLFANIQNLLKKTMQAMEAPMAEIKSKKNRSIEKQQELFAAVEQAVVSLLSTHHFKQQEPGMHAETAYEKFLTKKRTEMLDYLFEVMQKDRRSLPDRRSPKTRRNSNGSNYQEPKRRSGKDRRTGKNRRKSVAST